MSDRNRGVESFVPALATLPRQQLETMLTAGEEILECYRVLRKGALNVVGEVLRGQGTFYEMNHYPDGDVFDPDSHSQYYYHAHPDSPHEHGHFHTFVRSAGMPADIEPVAYDGDVEWPRGEDALAHLVAISMDPQGYPLGLFAVNRWVTGDTWYVDRDVIRLAERFEIDHAYPSWPTNRWITAMLKLFQPQIVALLRHRDRVIEDWSHAHPDVDVFEDRSLEVTGRLPANVEHQIEALREALAA